MEKNTLSTETVADAFLAMLRSRGIERIYVNGGTDFAPLVEAYARLGESGLDFPEPVIATHENLAVGMAHGAYLVTGLPQAVMLHVSVGTANAVMGIFNAARDRVPILLMAGRTPLFEDGATGSRNGSIHWSQEMYDQAGMLRELLKWDYELRDGLQVEEVLDRALTLAVSEPAAPVYLTLPREVLARPLEEFSFAEVAPPAATEPAPLPRAIDELADALASARFPVIVTSSSGRDSNLVEALGSLCERYSIGVVEAQPRFVCVAADHPLHLGYSVYSIFENADVICFLDCDVPWMPSAGAPNADAFVVQCGVDPLFSRYPIRTQRSDLTITASSAAVLAALEPALEMRRSSIPLTRHDRLAEAVTDRRRRREERLESVRNADGPIDKAYMNAALAEVFDDQTIIVNEYWASVDTLAPTLPGSMYSFPPSGGLGWGLPAALGVQQASPGKTVIATVGDGSYIFANPAACHLAMATHGLPVVTVVCNNHRWGAVEGAALGVYPHGHFAEHGSSPLAEFTKTTAFEQYAIASDGHGERVSERSELVPALRRAIDVARNEHRQALVHVISAD